MKNNVVDILLVEDSYDYASMLQVIFSKDKLHLYKLTHALCLEQALQYLAQSHFDVVLIDLALPDSQGLDTFLALHLQEPELPAVVLTAYDDEEMALQAVQAGAQDYLIKGEFDGHRLGRSLQYAIERQRTLKKLHHLSLVDDLTGLLNRRGFFSIAKQHLTIARRANRKLLLFFADLDDLKKINDRFGHQEGDRALRSVSSILAATFRSSDVLGRLGGDEFTILAIDANAHSGGIVRRLQASLRQENTQNPSYALSLSVGVARFDPLSDNTLEELLAEADRDLYIQKSHKEKV